MSHHDRLLLSNALDGVIAPSLNPRIGAIEALDRFASFGTADSSLSGKSVSSSSVNNPEGGVLGEFTLGRSVL